MATSASKPINNSPSPQSYDTWMLADLALYYETVKILKHEKQRKIKANQTSSGIFSLTETKDDPIYQNTNPSKIQKTINLMSSPVLTIINLLADQGDVSIGAVECLSEKFDRANDKIQTILEKKVVKKKKNIVNLKHQYIENQETDETGDQATVCNVYNLNFNEDRNPQIFNKKNSNNFRIVTWGGTTENNSKHGVYGDEDKQSYLDSTRASEINLPHSAINLNTKFEVQPQIFSFDDIPLNQFSNLRREIHSAFSSIPWTFADREDKLLSNNKNISEDEVRKNIPNSLKIRGVPPQNLHHTGVSRPTSTMLCPSKEHKYYGIEADAHLNDVTNHNIQNSKEVQALINLPENMLRDAVKEAVSLGLMSVDEAVVLLDLINRPLPDVVESLDKVAKGSRPISKETRGEKNLISIPRTPEDTTRFSVYNEGKNAKDSPRKSLSPRKTSKKNVECHQVAMLNPNIGFEPVEEVKISNSNPINTSVVLPQVPIPLDELILSPKNNISTENSARDVALNENDKNNCDNNSTVSEVVLNKIQFENENMQNNNESKLQTINEMQELTGIEKVKISKKAPEGCRARPCTAKD